MGLLDDEGVARAMLNLHAATERVGRAERHRQVLEDRQKALLFLLAVEDLQVSSIALLLRRQSTHNQQWIEAQRDRIEAHEQRDACLAALRDAVQNSKISESEEEIMATNALMGTATQVLRHAIDSLDHLQHLIK